MGELTVPPCKQAETNETNDPYSDTVYLSADTVYLDTVMELQINGMSLY